MPEIKKITGSQESIIQLELDEDEEEISPHQRRRYSVSPMPQMHESQVGAWTHSNFNFISLWIFKILFPQTSGRSTPETDDVDDVAIQIPPVGIILIHKPCGECSTTDDKKGNEENFARYATYPIVRGKCLVANKCTCDLDSVTPPPQNIHQTLDFPKSKKHSKRPTILKSDCDQNDSNSDINSRDAKNW